MNTNNAVYSNLPGDDFVIYSKPSSDTFKDIEMMDEDFGSSEMDAENSKNLGLEMERLSSSPWAVCFVWAACSAHGIGHKEYLVIYSAAVWVESQHALEVGTALISKKNQPDCSFLTAENTVWVWTVEKVINIFTSPGVKFPCLSQNWFANIQCFLWVHT